MQRVRLWLLIAALAVAAIGCAKRLRFSADIMSLLPPGLPEVQGINRVNRHFNREGQLLVTVAADDAASAERAAATLAEAVRARAGLAGAVFHGFPPEGPPAGAAALVAWLWLNGEPEALAGLAADLAQGRSPAKLEEALGVIGDEFAGGAAVVRGYDPFDLTRAGGGLGSLAGSGGDVFASPDGSFRVVFVEAAEGSLTDYRAAERWLAQLREVIDQWERDWEDSGAGTPVPEVGITGTPAFMAEIGGAMERDLRSSTVSTLVLVALLFWVIHRRLVPLQWLVAMMLVILVLTLGAAAWLFDELSLMSAGFAAVLIGLAIDYGVILYREAAHAGGDACALRRRAGPGILWAALTTAAVFLSLNFSSLPGIAQFGILVAVGVLAGAAVMLWGFAAVAVRLQQPKEGAAPGSRPPHPAAPWLSGVLSVAVPAAAAATLVVSGPPQLEAEFRPFRRASDLASGAWQEMEVRLGRSESVPIVVTGTGEADLYRNASAARQALAEAKGSGLIADFALPVELVPNPTNQHTNAPAALAIAAEAPRLVAELDAAGFTDAGIALTSEAAAEWARLAAQLGSMPPSGATLPSGPLAEWTAGRLTSRQPGESAVLGSVRPAQPGDPVPPGAIPADHTTAGDFGTLGKALNELVARDLTRVFLPIILLLAFMLAAVFRDARDVVLALFTMGFGAAALVLATEWSPLGWNSFNVCAVPLIFGTGIDYTIHMVFALRRERGDAAAAHATIGKAILFCGGSTAIGFGSLATATAEGLATMGQLCAAGALINTAVAVYLLPQWWKWTHRRCGGAGEGGG
jgi:predicted exporter